MKNTNKNTVSRRKFIGASATLMTGIAIASPSVFGAPNILKFYNKPNSLIKGVQIGAITYSFRSMPDQSAEATLQYLIDAGISATELMGDPAESFAGMPENNMDRGEYNKLRRLRRGGKELTSDQSKTLNEMEAQGKDHGQKVADWRASVSMDRFIQLKKMYKAAGVKIYGFKPRAFGKSNTDAEIDYGFRAAKALGASHITLEHPSDDEHTRKLGQMAAKHKIYVGYHGHTQQTPTFWDTALTQSKYNALNLDIGHYVAAGNAEPLEIIKSKHDSILSMHLKDRHNKKNGQANVPWGEGDTPIVEVLQLMRDQKYKFPATAELEYKIPDGSDAVKELAKCVDYCRKALES